MTLSIHLWDVFICHASEDKDDFARPLADLLKKEGVKVWFDDFEVKLGESIAQKIEKGLANSKAGLIILSRRSIQKNWPQYEASAIKHLYLADRMRLIPVLKNLSFKDLRSLSPGLIDLKGIDARKLSISECAYKIIEAVRPDILSKIHKQYVDRKLESHGKLITIDPAVISSGPKRRDKFPERDLLRLSVLHACFQDVMKDTLNDWIDSFSRDLNYEREIRVWERMAACYLRCLNGQTYDIDTKTQIFGLIMALFSGTEESYLQKGFETLPDEAGERLHLVIKQWLLEWRSALKLMIERELSDDSEVAALIAKHDKIKPIKYLEL